MTTQRSALLVATLIAMSPAAARAQSEGAAVPTSDSPADTPATQSAAAPAPTSPSTPEPATAIPKPPSEPPAVATPAAGPQQANVESQAVVPAASPSLTNPLGPISPEVGSGGRTGLGGYGEAELKLAGDEAEAKLSRFILYVGHSFTDELKLQSEIEVEDGHELEMEQAFIEYSPVRHLGIRAGLVLIPVGLVNFLHEPPTFNGVQRPLTDTLIVPSTWRELGVGVAGSLADGLRYQAYVTSGLDASKFSAENGIKGGRGQGLEIHVADAAVSGRLDYTGILGLRLGLGAYAGGAGREEPEVGGTSAVLVEADASYTRYGLRLRAEYVRGFIQGADRITNFLREKNPGADAVGSQMAGGYLEAGYDVFHLLRVDGELIPFARYENVNTRQVVPNVIGAERPDNQQFLFGGLVWKPDPRVSFKFDYRRALVEEEEMEGGAAGMAHGEEEEEAEEGLNQFSFGIGFMF